MEMLKHLIKHYNASLQENIRSGKNIASFFSVIDKSNPRQKAICCYLRITISKMLPMSLVEDKNVREFSKHDCHIGIKSFKETLLRLVEVVREQIF